MVPVLVLFMIFAGVADTRVPARPAVLSPAERDAVTREIERRRDREQRWLKQDTTSYLAAITRVDFGEKQTLTVGRAADNDVPLDADGVMPYHIRVTVDGDKFRVQSVGSEARFSIGGHEVVQALVDPSPVKVGRFTLRLSHQRFPAIIVFDPQSPRLKTYKGLKYFPVDFSYRYVLSLTPNPDPDTVIILSTLGHQRRAQRVGWFEFMVGDTPCRLEATRLLEPGSGEHDLIVLFRDGTSGAESYPLGRYVNPTRLADGRYVLDFNEAYNPACAYSAHYNCPIPPKANTLGVAIRAGEMDSHYH